MKKRSPRPSQQNISFRFRFVKLPVTWEILTGARWEQYKAATPKNVAAKLKRELTPDEIADFERRIPAAPLLRGQMRKIQTLDSEVLTEIADLRSLRDEFFALPEGDLDTLAGFLNKVGAWPSSGDPSKGTPGYALSFPVFVQPDEVWAFRRDLDDALLDRNRQSFKEAVTPVSSRPKTWLDLYVPHPANDFHLRFELSNVVAGVVTLTNARHALFATVLADIARGIRFKMCARKGCTVPFPITSKHGKKYHSVKCGHLALVQKQREVERKKREAEKRRKRRKSSRGQGSQR